MNREEKAAVLRKLFAAFRDCTDEELALTQTVITIIISQRKQRVLTP